VLLFLLKLLYYIFKILYIFVFYCLLLFSLNAGPAMTTYVLPAQTFPIEIRSTYNGISAACGKVGAAVGAYMVIIIFITNK